MWIPFHQVTGNTIAHLESKRATTAHLNMINAVKDSALELKNGKKLGKRRKHKWLLFFESEQKYKRKE